jgi:hypothetical protein
VSSSESPNVYAFVYKTVSSAGIVNPSYKKQTVEAENQEDAIETLRSMVCGIGDGSIRIIKIELKTKPQYDEIKKKKSPWGLIAAGLFVLASVAKLISRLF